MQVSKKALQGGDSSCVAAVRDLSASALFQELLDTILVDLRKGLYRPHPLKKKGEEEVDIAVVGLDGIFRKPFLGDQVMEEKFFCGKKLFGNGGAGNGRILREQSI